MSQTPEIKVKTIPFFDLFGTRYVVLQQSYREPNFYYQFLNTPLGQEEKVFPASVRNMARHGIQVESHKIHLLTQVGSAIWVSAHLDTIDNFGKVKFNPDLIDIPLRFVAETLKRNLPPGHKDAFDLWQSTLMLAIANI